VKILIIGPLGAGKSTLAYTLNRKFHWPRLNLDEVARIKGAGVRSPKEQHKLLKEFVQAHQSWVMEGSQKNLYEQVVPDLIVDMRICRLVAMMRFTMRFLKAKKLIGKDVAPDLPVQAYHYRKLSVRKIREWDRANRLINAEIGDFLAHTKIPIVQCRGYKDYDAVFQEIQKYQKRGKER